jgi:hypothetical protein
MRAAAKSFDLHLVDEPSAELSGSDDMYIPTTQIQIRPDGPWHRRSAIATETACGLSYAACTSREYELAGCLCKHCFTLRELWLAAHPDEIERPPR